MPVPTHADLVNPLLEAFHNVQGELSTLEQESRVAKLLDLSEADRSEIHRGSRTKLNYSLAWARNYLKRLGLIAPIERGVWELTDLGKKRRFVEPSEINALDSFSEPLDGLDSSILDELGPYPIDSVLIRQEARSAFEITRRILAGKFILDPDFQRDFIWDLDKQSKLIESTLLRIPLPVFYLAEREDGKTVVVDGLQRLTTFKRFLENEFPLRNLAFAADLNGLYFKDLPAKLQNRIEDSQLILYLIDSKVPEQAKLDIFERVNGGVPLSRQQMRNCIYTGPATRWLRAQADTLAFLEATDRSLSRSTMRDRECINRFCSFAILSVNRYMGDMDRFLAEGLQTMNTIGDEMLSELSRRFENSMRNNYVVFGKQCFRKHSHPSARRSVINVALFDVYSIILADVPAEHIHDLAEKIRATFFHLVEQPEFHDAITVSTNSTTKVRSRFRIACQAHSQFLSNYVEPTSP